MSDSSLEEYRKINIIIERDSADATYKYALLRGTIEICEEYQHLGKIKGDKIWFPLGLLIEKWIFYYYPLVASERAIPQKSGETAEGSNHLRMAFRPLLSEVVEHYKRKGGGLSHFYNDYEKGSIPPDISGTFLSLCRKLRDTITQMPMYHLGYSYSKMHNSIFNYKPKEGRIGSSKTIDRDFLVRNFGEYSISTDLNNVFLYFGGFISGENTLLLKWAKFSSERSNGTVSVADVIEILSQIPETEHNTWEALQFYQHLLDMKERVICVWTGQRIHALTECHFDHLLPFSIWKNNELWNLMPALPEVNEKKSAKIPSEKLLEKRKDTILHYWDLMMQYNPVLMEKEIRISLIGRALQPDAWKEQAFEAMKQKCGYLIDIRGYTEWNL